MPHEGDLVRRAVRVLSSERPVAELVNELGTLLGDAIGATAVELEREGAQTLRWGGEADGRAGAVSVPVVFGGERIGTLCVRSAASALSDEDLDVLQTCALYLGARITGEERRAAGERYERLAGIDELTGVVNRGGFDRALAREWQQAIRDGSPLSLLMLDVDFFKAYNDRNGHAAGDGCLQQVAAAAGACAASPGRLFARYGGEEFAALLPGVDRAEAIAIGEAMCAAVERRAIAHAASSLGRVTISVGAATLRPVSGEEPVALVRAADGSLYEAKQRGRNRVTAQGHASSRAAALPQGGARGNLPLPRTSFIGRRDDLVALSALAGANQLVTVVGAGGLGKTRLAVEVARRAAPAFADGAWFVDLTGIADGSRLEVHAISALKDLVSANLAPERLAAALRPLSALVVFDNCEHLVGACAALIEKIRAMPGNLSMLATSRQPLGIEGEVLYRVPALDERDGVDLFVDRATSAGFRDASVAGAAIGDIVRELDGLPLAIELAAPRLTTLSFDELRAGLGTSLLQLRAASRSAPSRQQTLRALIEWSFRLLSPAEQAVFRRVAVFSGGCTRAMAIEVCGDERLPPADVAAALDGLLEKSLLQADAQRHGERLRMLESTRDYAGELLASAPDAAPVRERHTRAFLTYALGLAARREATPTNAWLDSVGSELGNLQAALYALLDERRFDEAGQMLTALHDWFWFLPESSAPDLPQRLAAVLADADRLSPEARRAVALALATLINRTDVERSIDIAAPVYDEYLQAGEFVLAAETLCVVVEARFVLTATMDVSSEHDLAMLAARMEEAGNLALAVKVLNVLGILHTQNGGETRLRLAGEVFERAIALLDARGDADRTGILHANIADVAFHVGDCESALARIRRAIEIVGTGTDVYRSAYLYMNLGAYATWSRDYATARSALLTAYPASKSLEPYTAAAIVDKFARLAYELGQVERAAMLLGYADAAFALHGVARQSMEAPMVEKLRASVTEALADRFDAAYRRGQSLSPEEADAEVFAV